MFVVKSASAIDIFYMIQFVSHFKIIEFISKYFIEDDAILILQFDFSMIIQFKGLQTHNSFSHRQHFIIPLRCQAADSSCNFSGTHLYRGPVHETFN